jgi:hypothetical protein
LNFFEVQILNFSKFGKTSSMELGLHIDAPNVDAAFNAEKQQGATGVVIRDENSQVVAAKCKWYSSVPDALTAEAFAVRDGAALVNNLHWPKVVLETDSQSCNPYGGLEKITELQFCLY